MHVVYSMEEPPSSFTKSLFLAGPTPRSATVASWRPRALRILTKCGYDGVVFVPESRDGKMTWSYRSQIDWEHRMLGIADCIVFWVPRNLKTMPAFTTNVEFGLWAESAKVVFGAPQKAPKTNYLRVVAEKTGIPEAHTLRETIAYALQMVGNGALRAEGERYVPLMIWNTSQFQSWYQTQQGAGNRLDGAAVKWVFRVGPKRNNVYCWALHVNVHVAKENRNKTNEVILSRPDISTVVMYYPESKILESKVVLVREFRSPARTPDGFIWELPGGSSFTPNTDPLEVASEEVNEETGFSVEKERLKSHGRRQLVGTFSTHTAHVFSVKLTQKELEWLHQQEGIVHGLSKDNPTGERTYVEIRSLKELLLENLADWSTVGMILSVIMKPDV